MPVGFKQPVQVTQVLLYFTLTKFPRLAFVDMVSVEITSNTSPSTNSCDVSKFVLDSNNMFFFHHSKWLVYFRYALVFLSDRQVLSNYECLIILENLAKPHSFTLGTCWFYDRDLSINIFSNGFVLVSSAMWTLQVYYMPKTAFDVCCLLEKGRFLFQGVSR
jgi:hypothetical protein